MFASFIYSYLIHQTPIPTPPSCLFKDHHPSPSRSPFTLAPSKRPQKTAQKDGFYSYSEKGLFFVKNIVINQHFNHNFERVLIFITHLVAQNRQASPQLTVVDKCKVFVRES